MDPLSEVLALLNTQSSFFAGLKAGGDWPSTFPRPMASSSTRSSRRLLAERRGRGAGDPAGTRRLLPAVAQADVFIAQRSRPAGRSGGSGVSPCRPGHRPLWHGRWVLPDRRALRVRRGRRFAGRRTAARRRGQERIGAGGGAELGLTAPGPRAGARLAGRRHRDPAPGPHHAGGNAAALSGAGGDGAPSWLLAVSDPRVGAAIQAIHADPARVWTVEALAEVAGVSRSTLALHFKRKAGIAPLEYCCAGACNWRRAR